GRLGISAINLGQYLNAGTTVATLDAVEGQVFVDISLPQEQLPGVTVGMPVRIMLRGDERPVHGVVKAISPTVDPSTRNARVRASVPNQDRRLRPGMFVTAELVTPKRTTVVTVPATAVIHAPYGDSVFIIEDKPRDAPGMRTTPDGKSVKIARQQFVRLGAARGDFVAIVEGLTAGQPIVSAGAFKLRNGSPIVIENAVRPTPQTNPHPENR
nr:efflux RND transporter periplasmic adaptor subunit [Deltaproteobacteria bacterium]